MGKWERTGRSFFLFSFSPCGLAWKPQGGASLGVAKARNAPPCIPLPSGTLLRRGAKGLAFFFPSVATMPPCGKRPLDSGRSGLTSGPKLQAPCSCRRQTTSPSLCNNGRLLQSNIVAVDICHSLFLGCHCTKRRPSRGAYGGSFGLRNSEMLPPLNPVSLAKGHPIEKSFFFLPPCIWTENP